MKKPKLPQLKTPAMDQSRDKFETPAYATDLIAPYLSGAIWEPAAGGDRIVNHLRRKHGKTVHATTLERGQNFLDYRPNFNFDMIVTNVPYSIKEKFYHTCVRWCVPFALLIPTEWSSWLLAAMQDGCQWIVPNRRIIYITPFLLRLVYHKSTMENFRKGEPEFVKKWEHLNRRSMKFENLAPLQAERYQGLQYSRVDDIPSHVIAKYSSSQFHSGWLCKGLNLEKQVNVVDLPLSVIREHMHE